MLNKQPLIGDMLHIQWLGRRKKKHSHERNQGVQAPNFFRPLMLTSRNTMRSSLPLRARPVMQSCNSVGRLPEIKCWSVVNYWNSRSYGPFWGLTYLLNPKPSVYTKSTKGSGPATEIVCPTLEHNNDCALRAKTHELHGVLLHNLADVWVTNLPIFPVVKLIVILMVRAKAHRECSGWITSILTRRKNIAWFWICPVLAPLRLNVIFRRIHTLWLELIRHTVSQVW